MSASAVSVAAPIVKFTKTALLEWDLPLDMDFTSGAITSDGYSGTGNRLLFVTRNGEPRLFLFKVPKDAKHGLAAWTSHKLDIDFLGPTGGLKRLRASHDRRFVFVKTLLAVQKVDTYTNQVTPYPDTISFVSDIAVDKRYNVFSTADDLDGTGFLQRLDASVHGCFGAACPEANVTRWELVGIVPCVAASGSYTPCILGVAVHPKYQHLVYVAEDKFITEVDTNSKSCWCPNPKSRVRRWDLEEVGGPGTKARQIQFDSDGLLWVNTNNDTFTNALLVSLDTRHPTSNRMTSHRIPDGGVPEGGIPKDSFAIGPDGGAIGHTANDFFTEHAVSMLSPRFKATAKPVTPTVDWVTRTTDTIQPPRCDATERKSGFVSPRQKKVTTRITSKADGKFVEAFINQETNGMLDDSTFPLGIAPDMDRAVGTFFYAVGEAPFGNPVAIRIGLARLPRDNEKGKKDRDDEDRDDDGQKRGDDDDDDDDGRPNYLDNDDDDDEIPDGLDDDDDNDGINNEHDRKDSKEFQDRHWREVAANQADEFTMTAGSHTLAFVATAASSDLLAPVSIEIRNALGLVVAGAPPIAGVALVTHLLPAPGEYTVRVTNHGLNPAEIETTLIGREPF